MNTMTDECRDDICWCYDNVDKGCPTSYAKVGGAIAVVLLVLACCVFGIRKCFCNNPVPVIYAGSQQAPLLPPGVNSAAPNLLQQQMGSGMLIQPGQPGQPPQQFQQHQQQPLPQQAHLQHQPAGLVQAAAGLPAAAAPSSSLAEFCARI